MEYTKTIHFKVQKGLEREVLDYIEERVRKYAKVKGGVKKENTMHINGDLQNQIMEMDVEVRTNGVKLEIEYKPPLATTIGAVLGIFGIFLYGIGLLALICIFMGQNSNIKMFKEKIDMICDDIKFQFDSVD